MDKRINLIAKCTIFGIEGDATEVVTNLVVILWKFLCAGRAEVKGSAVGREGGEGFERGGLLQ